MFRAELRSAGTKLGILRFVTILETRQNGQKRGITFVHIFLGIKVGWSFATLTTVYSKLGIEQMSEY